MGKSSETPKRLATDVAQRLLAIRRENLIDVSQPLVLIAQQNRSGGTLLSQLFDGHPELHVHPGELQWQGWPSLDTSDPPEALVAALRERHIVRGFQRGYHKDRPARKLGYEDQLQSFPLVVDPTFLRELFVELATERAIESRRDVIRLYFTALHNAWLDNQNLYVRPKRWVVAFRGKLRLPEHLAGFFGDYPDGRHITCVREPKARIASKVMYNRAKAGINARTGIHSAESEGIGEYAERWRLATEMQLAAKRRYGDRVFVLTFERLVTETEWTMRALAGWLGIRYEATLTEPTFNRIPTKANSSFRVNRPGVLSEPLGNWRGVLSDEDARTIDAQTRDLYESVRALTA